MDTLRCAVSALVNSICFRPLKAQYDFDFSHRERRVVWIPIDMSSVPSSPVSSSPVRSSASVVATTATADSKLSSCYHVPCMLIQGAGSSSSSAQSNPQEETEDGATTTTAAAAGGGRKLCLLFHGTSGDIAKSARQWASLLKDLLDWDVLIVEYPGYGSASPLTTPCCSSSPFFPSRESVMAVARGVTQFAIDDLRIPPSSIFFCGRSMGSGPATELAAEFTSCGGLILLSPYACMSEVIANAAATRAPLQQFLSHSRLVFSLADGLVKFLCRFGRTSMFQSEKYVGSVRAPMFVAHGQLDKLIPVEHAHRLMELGRQCESKTLHIDPNGEHSGLSYEREMVKWMMTTARAAQEPEDTNSNNQKQQRGGGGASSYHHNPWTENADKFASAATVAELRRSFPADVEFARAIKNRHKVALIAAVCAFAVVSVACCVVAWKFGVRRFWH